MDYYKAAPLQFSAQVMEARGIARLCHLPSKYGEHDYVFHLDAVAEIVSARGEEALIIAYLHDTLEDTALTFLQIAQLFGYHIAQCVELITDPKGLSRKERKVAVNKSLSAITRDGPFALALVVKAADRLANVRECVTTDNKSLLDMYRREHTEFEKAVVRPGLNDFIMARLEDIFSNNP